MNRYTLIAGFLFVVSMAIAAQDFESLGYTVERRGTDEGVPRYDLLDSDGNRLSVTMAGSLTDQRAEALDQRYSRPVPVSSKIGRVI